VLVQIANYAAWAISAIILVWMLVDTVRVETTYDHDLLVSSVEGEIEKEIQGHVDTVPPPRDGE
jgi:hypothetical protein